MSGLTGGAKYPTAKDLGPILNLQTNANIKTAGAQTALNSINQRTPYGSLTYKQVGTWPNGAPRFISTTTLSPQEQALLTGQQKVQQAMQGAAGMEAGHLGDTLGTPLDLSDSSIGSAIMDRYQPRLDAEWQKNYDSQQADLANRGVRLGSTAYDRAMSDFNNSKTDAYNQMMINARGQAVGEMVTGRNQPINEISALMSGSQVQNPQFGSTPQTGINATDITGTANSIYQQNQANSQAAMGGLFGLGGAVAGGLLGGPLGSAAGKAFGGWAGSDRDLKEDVKQIGKLDDGTKVYKFAYKGDGGLSRLGLMAQDVEKRHPEAVRRGSSGFKEVNYSDVVDRVAA